MSDGEVVALVVIFITVVVLGGYGAYRTGYMRGYLAANQLVLEYTEQIAEMVKEIEATPGFYEPGVVVGVAEPDKLELMADEMDWAIDDFMSAVEDRDE